MLTEGLRLWVELHATDKAPWYRPWHRGYIQACRDLLFLEKANIAILPLEEYRAIEGSILDYLEAEYPFP